MGAAVDDVVDKDEFIDCAPSHIIHLPSEGKRGNHFTLALLLFRSSHHHSAIASHRISSSRFLDTHARTWTMYCLYYIYFLPLFMPVYIFVTLSWQFLFKQNIFSFIYCTVYISMTRWHDETLLSLFPMLRLLLLFIFGRLFAIFFLSVRSTFPDLLFSPIYSVIPSPLFLCHYSLSLSLSLPPPASWHPLRSNIVTPSDCD